MVKLPKSPFREFEIDDTHPFVVEALRPRKHFEPCWCGSGAKYKNCHRDRTTAEPIPMRQVLHEQRRIFWRKRGCMHPHASTSNCSSTVIDAHSIQRKGPLHKIVDNKNHVLQLLASPETKRFAPKPIGWREASTFPGYCSAHDSALFQRLERSSFTGTHEECVLVAFRNVCYELYKKRALIETLQFQRGVIDHGVSIHEQIARQLSIAENINGQTKSVEELEAVWNKFETAVTADEFDKFSSRTFYFDGDLSVTSSSILQVDFDFAGNKYADLWNLSVDAEVLSHAVLDSENGGALVFTWLTEEEAPKAAVDSFESVADSDKGDVFVQYCFLKCENNYFSSNWWNGLDRNAQNHLKKLAPILYYEGGAFEASDPKLVNWKFG